jgi:tRNA-modifying protein YgfZ
MDPKVQVQAAKEGALAVQHADLATLAVTGKDRVTWLNGLLTCELAKRAPGDAVYGLVVERKGHVLADVVAVVDDPDSARPKAAESDARPEARVLLVVPVFTVESLQAHLEHYLVMEDCEVTLANGWEVWSVHGPRAAAALEAARAAGGVGGTLDRTGLGGAIALAPPEVTREVAAAIAGVATVGDDAGWEALRLERGVPRFGVDFDDKTYPQEAQLEKVAVSFDKGCYLGQEVVCMLEMRGHVKRKLVPVVLDAEGAPPPRGAPVTDEQGAPVGEVTSAGTSPTLGKPVAMAMVKRAFAEAGKRLVVAGASGEVVERPA